LRDPFLLDVALQAGQLVVPQWVMLPVHIGRIEIHNCQRPVDGVCLGQLRMHGQNGTIMPCSATVVDLEGRTLIRLEDYQLKVLGRKMTNPTADELAHPEERDERILVGQAAHWANVFGVRAPQLALSRIADLSGMPREERRRLETPLVSRALETIQRGGKQ
jgi:hypothetical protein